MEPRNQQTAATGLKTYDAGLRAHMLRIYNRMTLGVLTTGLVAYAFAASGLVSVLYANPILAIILAFSPLAVVWFGFRPDRMSSGKLQFSFFLISALYGLSFSSIFLVYAGTDIARAFFLAAASFAGLSLFGYTTKKNLDGMGSFLIMGMFGLIILSVVNMFMASTVMQNVVAGAGILIFSGLTAWETQKMKEMYNPAYDDETASRVGWASALNLYISFIALFHYILHFVGMARGE